MSPVVQPQSPEMPIKSVPDPAETISLGGRIGVLLFVFFALAMITIEIGRCITTLWR
jgi:hypothetical protein